MTQTTHNDTYTHCNSLPEMQVLDDTDEPNSIMITFADHTHTYTHPASHTHTHDARTRRKERREREREMCEWKEMRQDSNTGKHFPTSHFRQSHRCHPTSLMSSPVIILFHHHHRSHHQLHFHVQLLFPSFFSILSLKMPDRHEHKTRPLTYCHMRNNTHTNTTH